MLVVERPKQCRSIGARTMASQTTLRTRVVPILVQRVTNSSMESRTTPPRRTSTKFTWASVTCRKRTWFRHYDPRRCRNTVCKRVGSPRQSCERGASGSTRCESSQSGHRPGVGPRTRAYERTLAWSVWGTNRQRSFAKPSSRSVEIASKGYPTKRPGCVGEGPVDAGFWRPRMLAIRPFLPS